MADIVIAGMPFSGYEHVRDVLVSAGVPVLAAPASALVRCTPSTVARALDEALAGFSRGDVVVFVYRNPWDSALASLCSGERRLVDDPDVVRQAWQAYHAEVCARFDAGVGKVFLVSYDAVVRDAAALAALVVQLTGRREPDSATPPGASFDPNGELPPAHRGWEDPISHLYRLVYPASTLLLDQLDARAAVPSGSSAHGNGRLDHVLHGGSLAAGTGVQVIIPCRNDGRFIVEAVASVARTADEPVEMTVVDDGSDDPETLRVLQCLRDAGFQVLAGGGQGICKARNLAISVSSTAAVLPLDADNVLRPALLGALPLIDQEEADVVCGAQSAFGLQSRVYRPPAVTWESMMPHNPVDQCALIRRSLLDAIGGWDPEITWWEDWDMWMSALEQGARFQVLPDITFDYLVRGASRTRTVGMETEARAAAWRAIYRKHREGLADVVIEGFIALDQQRLAEAAARRRWQTHFELLHRQVLLSQSGDDAHE